MKIQLKKNQKEGDNKLITTIQKPKSKQAKSENKNSPIKETNVKQEKKESQKLPKVKEKLSLLNSKEKKILSLFNSKRKKENLKPVDEVSYDSYLNFKNSLSIMIKRPIKLEYDVFEALVKKYKIKTV